MSERYDRRAMYDSSQKIFRIDRKSKEITEFRNIHEFSTQQVSSNGTSERQIVSNCVRHKIKFYKEYYYVYENEKDEFLKRLNTDDWEPCSICGDKQKYFVKHDHSDDERITPEIKELYQKHGIQVLNLKWFGEYNVKFKKGIRSNNVWLSVEKIAKELGIHEEYLNFKARKYVQSYNNNETNHKTLTSWTDEKKDEVTEEIIARFKTIPRVSILRLSGYTNYCRHVDLNEMRKKYNCPIIDLHLSLDGRSWDSEAEACNANFLLSRGVIIDKKEFYSNEFQEMTNLSRAKYDG